MALQITTNINVDFYDKEYIMLNAKQNDSNSRLIAITCYHRGKPMTIHPTKQVAYVRYKKADGHGVLNYCRINSNGEILVELTEQMLAADGICYVDLVVVDKGNAVVNVDTGEIITIDGSEILSTMAFCVNVYETAIDNSLVESTYEYDALNKLLTTANADYQEVIQTAKSWAVGDTDIRVGEDTDNAKYYSGLASTSSANASRSETNAKTYMNSAKVYKENANEFMNTTKDYLDTTKTYMDAAETSATNASASEVNAKNSENNAAVSETNAEASMNAAKTSETNSATSETNAKASETTAVNSANLAQSYAVGGTGTRDDENVDNAKHYYEVVKSVANGLSGGFIPMGTITFADLANAEKVTGFTYSISDDFLTTEDFAEGPNHSYTAGTNVFVRADGLLDCLGGTSVPVASIEEVEAYLGI